jgi:hypothetical protein
MAEVSKSEGGEVVPPQLPIPYVTNYTNKTLTIIPLLLTSLRVWAIAMLEWGSLRFIDHAPISVWVSSALIAGLVLVVLEKREWLNFKNRRYFPISLSVLMTIWIGIVGFAYYLDTPSQASANVAKVTKDNADDDRDAVVRHLVTALNERDQARRDLASTKRDLEAARAQQPQSTPVAPADSAPLSWEGNPNWVTFGGATKLSSVLVSVLSITRSTTLPLRLIAPTTVDLPEPMPPDAPSRLLRCLFAALPPT